MRELSQVEPVPIVPDAPHDETATGVLLERLRGLHVSLKTIRDRLEEITDRLIGFPRAEELATNADPTEAPDTISRMNTHLGEITAVVYDISCVVEHLSTL